MYTCSSCFGEGSEYFEEDGRMVMDTCYHCSGSGKVDSETHLADQVGNVANILAANRISSLQKSYNSNPDGEGWDFAAAENGLSSLDYYNERVGSLCEQFTGEIFNLSHEVQLALINTFFPEEKPDYNNTVTAYSEFNLPSNEDDNIPF